MDINIFSTNASYLVTLPSVAEKMYQTMASTPKKN